MKLVSNRTNWILAVCVVALMVLPLVFVHGAYTGSDDQGSEAIAALRPGFKPWFHSIWTPPSSEIESLLFALQAAIGAGVIGYVLGRAHAGTKSLEGTDKTNKSKPTKTAS